MEALTNGHDEAVDRVIEDRACRAGCMAGCVRAAARAARRNALLHAFIFADVAFVILDFV